MVSLRTRTLYRHKNNDPRIVSIPETLLTVAVSYSTKPQRGTHLATTRQLNKILNLSIKAIYKHKNNDPMIVSIPETLRPVRVWHSTELHSGTYLATTRQLNKMQMVDLFL